MKYAYFVGYATQPAGADQQYLQNTIVHMEYEINNKAGLEALEKAIRGSWVPALENKVTKITIISFVRCPGEDKT